MNSIWTHLDPEHSPKEKLMHTYTQQEKLQISPTQAEWMMIPERLFKEYTTIFWLGCKI